MTKKELLLALQNVRDDDHIEIQVIHRDEHGKNIGYTWYDIANVDDGFRYAERGNDYVPVFLTVGAVTGDG